MAGKPKNTPTPNPLTHEVKSLRNELANCRERIYQYELACAEHNRLLSEAGMQQRRSADAQNKMQDEIKALKEENARLKSDVADVDMLKGAVNALRRVIVEALTK